MSEALEFTIQEVPRTNKREGNYWQIKWVGGGIRPASAPERQLWLSLTAMQAERDALQARVVALEKDAARYRWLRNEADGEFHCDHSGSDHRITINIPWDAASGEDQGELIDDAIDAALKETQA